MKRAYRLRAPEQYQRVRRDGRSWDVALLALNAAPNRRRVSRCGFVAAKRLGGAVVRNRIRRRMREAVRLMYTAIDPGWDLVFIARAAALADIDFQQLQAMIQQLLQRAGVWKPAQHQAGHPQGTVPSGYVH
ncbi:MAG: ribonuclease P protein component [Chloroflexi bacterium]|nr:ribonuclease P protein component [Chloroflexota bacterium]